MRAIDKIVIHCSASDIKEHDNIKVIKEWHLERGWNDVGYHFFIKKNGDIQMGRPIEKSGAHVKGHNSHSIGICYSGLVGPTVLQEETLLALTRNLVAIFNLKRNQIYGHHELDKNKTCPNMDMDKFRESF